LFKPSYDWLKQFIEDGDLGTKYAHLGSQNTWGQRVYLFDKSLKKMGVFWQGEKKIKANARER